ALERLAEVDCVVFDKTGTLTMGMPEPVGIDRHNPHDLAIAAALAASSSHPLAQALAVAADARGVSPVAIDQIREVPGHGIEGSLDGAHVRLGRAEWVGTEPGAQTATWLSVAGQEPVEFAFADRLRPGAAELVAALHQQGLPVYLLSGDV